MKLISVAVLAILLVSCGREATSEMHDADGILVATRDANGGIRWVCLQAAGGGDKAGSAYLQSWEPDAQGRCWKEAKK
jgi:hypothetical protein